ncbi:Domain of unknown function DUF1791 [Thermocrinis albus DSM 14484]|uniref:Uncharacterized protein n=1 Tax=Thermocrinis albus (strain DSM 14484 / JCM 11386 / HI 11/12) TaxID=638303 RepID=D3SLU6_THEAH|nr:DsrE family protein [Thermocrinis albus]ADC89726.1 Domain of unknown function DUF1791 [Thermocrinis albus DSM 14484]
MARVVLALLMFLVASFSKEKALYVQTEYAKPFRVVVEFYFDHPEKIRPALGWVSNIVYVLTNPPYNYPLEDIDIVVISHGRELEAFVKRNREKYRDVVERMESLSQYGVKFFVCAMAARQLYNLKEEDFYPFVTLVPSAITELAHWQHKGYALIIPQIFFK